MNSKDSIIKLYHSSNKVIEKPYLGGGELTNDYGSGFYCTTDGEIVQIQEYATWNINIINEYSIDISNLAILNLTELDIIYWITLITTYRGINVSSENLNKLKQKYMIDLDKYDCVYGWRCDGTISTVINNFFMENITSDAIYEAIKTELIQSEFVLKSQHAFDKLKFINSRTAANNSLQRIDIEKCIKDCQRKHRNGKYIKEAYYDR